MKKLLLLTAVVAFTGMSFTAAAQDEEKTEQKEKKEKKESQEIIIRKKGDKDTKIVVEIKGDKVTINGKPISEFKDGDITINKRDIKIWDGRNSFSFDPGDLNIDFKGPFNGSFNSDSHSAFLGVTTEVYNKDEKKGDDAVLAEDDNGDGAKITAVTKESAAAKAGLQEGDIITKVNDKKITGPQSLAEAITSYKPKDEVTVYYKRDGKDKSAKAVLGENAFGGAMAYSFAGPDGNVRSFTMPKIPRGGMSLGTDGWKSDGDAFSGFDRLGSGNGFTYFPRQQKLGLKIQDTEDGTGVKVLDTDKDSPAEKAGLKKDDVITEIGGKKITNTDEARTELRENGDKAAYNIKAKRNGSEMSFDIKIPKKLKTADL
ncbi:MAG: PDZ domain-containing protein [Bacteroidetes bacterium]|nr:PDZ domain-containing protein [Bacteroidota bacterium]